MVLRSARSRRSQGAVAPVSAADHGAPAGDDPSVRWLGERPNRPGAEPGPQLRPEERPQSVPTGRAGEPTPPANEEPGLVMRRRPIGAELRAARETAGLDLADVAAHLRIRANFLSALEDGRAEALPGVTYAIGYVRTYAAFLGLDPEDAVRRFKQEAAGLHAKTELSFPSPAPEGKVPGVGLMIAAAVLATIAYGGWYVLSERGVSLDDLVPAVPERLAELIETDPARQPPATADGAPSPDGDATAVPSGLSSYSQANPEGSGVVDRRAVSEVQGRTERSEDSRQGLLGDAPATDPATAATTAPADETAVADVDAEPDLPPVVPAPVPPVRIDGEEMAATAARPDPSTAEPANAAEPLSGESGAVPATGVEPDGGSLQDTRAAADPTARAAIPAIPTAPSTAGGTAATPPASRVVIRATGESWIQIEDASGATLFTRILRAGDLYRVPNQPGLTMKTGNAGTLTVVVDGRALPPLGDFGEVVRNISLDPAALTERAGETDTIVRPATQ